MKIREVSVKLNIIKDKLKDSLIFNKLQSKLLEDNLKKINDLSKGGK